MGRAWCVLKDGYQNKSFETVVEMFEEEDVSSPVMRSKTQENNPI